MADYNALFQAPNAGLAFSQGFQQGQQQRQQMVARQAMQALAVDPTNQRAIAALSAVNPEAAISFKEKAQAHQLQQLSAHRDNIKIGAQILRAINPTDEAGYQQARALYAQATGDATMADIPQHFDPQYVKNVIALDQQLNPDSDPTAGTIKEFQQAIAGGLLPKETSYQQFLQMKNPGMLSPVTIPYGATIQTPGQVAGGSPTATDAHGNKVQYNPQSGKWEPMGGAGGNASGGFPQ